MVDSDALKNTIDGLTKLVNFLTTDFGQTLVKAGVGLVAFGGAFKLLGGLASLVISPFRSANRVFGLFGKTAGQTVKPLEKVGKGMKVVKAPTIGAAKAAGQAVTGFSLLGGSFSGLASILTSPAGLIAAMLALGAGIMYVNAKINKSKTPEAQYEQTHKKLGKLESKYDEVGDAIDRLHKKQEEGGLTSSEEAQLDALESEREAIQENIELYRQLAKAQKTASARTADPNVDKTDKVKSKQRPVTKASPLGAMSKQAEKDAGAVDLLTSKMVLYGDASKKVAEANNKVAKAQEKAVKAAQSGDPAKMERAEKGLTKALDEQETARKNLNKSFKDMKKTNDELKEFYGSQDRMPDDIRKSSEAVDKMVQSYDSLVKLNEKGGEKGVDFMGLSGGSLDKAITDFKNLGDAVGITVDESGKLQSVNFDTFSSSMEQMGYTTEETKSALQMLGEQHPEATFEIEGIEVAGKDVDTVLDYLDKVDGDDAEATVEINGSEVAVKDIKDIQQLGDKINGAEFKSVVEVEGGEEAAQTTGDIDKHIDAIPDEKVVNISQNGAETTTSSIFTVQGATNALPQSKNVNITETGAQNSKVKIDSVKKSEDALYNKSVNINATKSGESAWSRLKGLWDSIRSKTVNIHTTRSGSTGGGNAHGTRHAKFGMSMVNEYGYEYIRDEKTGALRVANKGRRGLTMLNEGDIVYTHGESMRMRQAQEEEIPKYAKGKKLSSKKKKELKKAKDSYKKHIDRIRGQYDSRIDDLEHQQAMEHHSDTWMGSQMQKAWDKYNKKLKKYNKSKSVKKWLNKWKKYGFKTTGSLGKQRRYDKDETKEDARYDVQANKLESEIENLGFSLEDRYLDKEEVQAEQKRLKKLKDKHKLSAEDYDKYMDTIYHNYVASQMKMYEAGEKTAEDMKAVLKEQAEDGKITWNEYYDYIDEIAENEKEKEEERLEKLKEEKEKAIEDEINNYHLRNESIDTSIAKIQQLAKEGQLTSEEELGYIKELKQKYLDQFSTMYSQGKKTYAEMRALIEEYYKDNTLTAEEYYDKLDGLASNQLAKEQDALSKRQEQANNENSLARAWIQRKISDLEKQNEEQEEQNELIEKQMDLEKAKAKRVRVYREGVGFVYEQDTEAIKDASKALQDYKKQQEDPAITEWKNILALFDDADELANIKNLENLTGLVANADFGRFGTNQSLWSNWIQGNVSTSKGIGLLLNKLGEMEDPEQILELLGASGNISEGLVNEYINKSRYTSGALRTKAGFDSVGGQGYDVALFGASNSVISHNLSKNLMEWGQMSPLEYAQAGGVGGDMYNYSFDKLVLPNVHNADDFMRELKNLPNRALQFSGGRA